MNHKVWYKKISRKLILHTHTYGEKGEDNVKMVYSNQLLKLFYNNFVMSHFNQVYCS